MNSWLIVVILSLKPTIMKFGGTCVEDAAAFERVANIVRSHKDSPCVVVVSAMSGVTDALLDTIARAESSTTAPGRLLDDLKPHFDRHLLVAQKLVGRSDLMTTLLESAEREIASLLADISEEAMPLPLLQDLVVSYGERLSAPLLAEACTQAGVPARHIDARRCIRSGTRVSKGARSRSRTSPPYQSASAVAAAATSGVPGFSASSARETSEPRAAGGTTAATATTFSSGR